MLKKKLILFFCIFINFCFAAEKKVIIDNLNFKIIPDNNFSVKQIFEQDHLIFQKKDKLYPSKNLNYWIKIRLNKNEVGAKRFYLHSHPAIDNTLYYFNTDSSKIINSRSGFLVANGNRHKSNYFEFNSDSIITLYIKMNLHSMSNKQKSFLPHFSITKADELESREQQMFIAWILVVVLILIHIFYVFVDFLIFKERTQLYYLLALIGSLIYITSYHKFFNILLDWKILSVQYVSETMFYSFELSDLMSYIGISIILYACVFMTSNFLMLEKYLPKWNTIIKRVLGFSLLFIFATQVLIYFTPFNFIKEFVFLNNVIVVITFFLLFLLGIVSYRKKNPHSKIFLIANSIPFLVAILTAVYTLFYNYHSYTMMYLPYLSIASFTITFSIALAFRNKNIQKELKLKEIETSLLKIENEKNSMIKKSLKEKEVLLKEIHHRVKNNLQVVSSLLGLQSSNIEDENVKKIFAESKNKIQAISLIHQTLYQNKDLAEIDMDEYFKNMYVHILSLFGHEAKKVEFQLDTNNIKFDIDTSVPIALIFNELVTNSLKYAFRDLQVGQLKVELTKLKEGVFCLKVEDNGRGFKTEEMRKNSLGLQLVQMLSSQLNGSFECNSDNGTKISIIFEDTKQRKLAE